MDDWTMADTLSLCDRIAEEHANAEFLAAVKNGDQTEIEFELQHGRDPNLPVLKKVPFEYAKTDDFSELVIVYKNGRKVCFRYKVSGGHSVSAAELGIEKFF